MIFPRHFQISGKIKRASEVMPDIRTLENREMVDNFIESGERLNDKLRRLLKRCEDRILNFKNTNGKLCINAGVKFIDTLLGRDYQLGNTERFMSSVRIWNLRFDANCKYILDRPETGYGPGKRPTGGLFYRNNQASYSGKQH